MRRWPRDWPNSAQKDRAAKQPSALAANPDNNLTYQKQIGMLLADLPDNVVHFNDENS